MKKFVLLLASLSLMVGLVGAEAASAAGPPAVSASHRAADLSKLNHRLAKLHHKKLTAKQASALGLHALSRDQVARLAKLQKSHAAKAADVGTYFWYEFQGYPGFVWVNRDYSGPYYSYPWYPYYVIYDNPYMCDNFGANCQQVRTYYYTYYLYYYPNQTWYYYGPSGYSYGYQVGFGPYGY